LNDVHLLAGVIRRCAFALPPSEIELARAQFSEGVQLLASIAAQPEVGQLLEWWAEAEAAAGCYARAFDLGVQALEQTRDGVTRMHRTSNVSGYALAMGDVERGKPFIDEALKLATTFQHVLSTAIAIAYTAAIHADEEPRESALLFGYAQAQMDKAGWRGISSDERARAFVANALRSRLGESQADRLFAEGGSWTAEQVYEKLNTWEYPASAAGRP
jgi:hypothetical protein